MLAKNWFTFGAPNAGGTLLTGPPLTPEQVAQEQLARTKEADAEDAARAVLECLVKGYRDGDIPFESFCRRCFNALAPEAIPVYVRQKLLGACVQAAIEAPPPSSSRDGRKSRGQWLNQLCSDLCDLVKEREGLPLVRKAKGQTAFERVSEILISRGVREATPATVEKARSAWRKHTETE